MTWWVDGASAVEEAHRRAAQVEVARVRAAATKPAFDAAMNEVIAACEAKDEKRLRAAESALDTARAEDKAASESLLRLLYPEMFEEKQRDREG